MKDMNDNVLLVVFSSRAMFKLNIIEDTKYEGSEKFTRAYTPSRRLPCLSITTKLGKYKELQIYHIL